MKRLIAILFLLLSAPALAADLSGATNVAVGATVWLDVAGEPAFDGGKTVNENLDVFRAWLKTTAFKVSVPSGSTPVLEPDVQIKFSFTDASLVWDMRARLVPDKPGVYVVAALLGSELALHRVEAGPVVPPPPPPPPPKTAPWESQGLSVLILRESQSTGSLPLPQRAIFTNSKVLRWLTDNAKAGFRIWDDDIEDVGNAPEVLKQAFAVVKAAIVNDVPTLGISNGKTGYLGPLPQTAEELLALLEQYK